MTRATEVMGQKEEKKEKEEEEKEKKEEEEKEKKEEEKKADWRGTGRSKALQEVLADLKMDKRVKLFLLCCLNGWGHLLAIFGYCSYLY